MVYEAARTAFMPARRPGGSRNHARPRARTPARRAGRRSVLEGEGVGRPYELGARSGLPRASCRRSPTRRRWRGSAPTTTWTSSPRGTSHFLASRPQHTARFDDRTIVVERFRDEIGDWRVCILTRSADGCTRRGRWRSPRGSAMRSGWRCSRLVRRRIGCTCPTPRCRRDRRPADRPDELEEIVVQEVGQSASFGAGSARTRTALLIPRRRPGQRTPSGSSG